MPKPTFLIIGAMKAGTTSLQRYLRKHPQVHMTRPKELHYFDRPPNQPGGTKWAGKIPDDAAYEALFAKAGPAHLAIGEASPTYCFVPLAIERIREYDPGMRLVMIMRDPVARAISHIRQRAWKTDEEVSEWEELVADVDSESGLAGRDWFERRRGYHARGRYHEQLDLVFASFPREQVLLMRLEDLAEAPEAEMKRVTDFLGADPFQDFDFRPFNAREYERPNDDILEYLRQYYRPHNELLHAKHGVSIEGWV